MPAKRGLVPVLNHQGRVAAVMVASKPKGRKMSGKGSMPGFGGIDKLFGTVGNALDFANNKMSGNGRRRKVRGGAMRTRGGVSLGALGGLQLPAVSW